PSSHVYTSYLHDALPILFGHQAQGALPFHRQRQSAGSSGRSETLFSRSWGSAFRGAYAPGSRTSGNPQDLDHHGAERLPQLSSRDRKSTRLNSSHGSTSY